ncbi:hypothetical protein HNR00_003517 [Methylorubrum rhodinum]|uniref:Uncharacterized protein n=1 Tax=Methylorubrum rhodinum TaxID=29428 RepID=A0A840ZN92_9HYPH|nr:hypothetical protein [Methylorubrum rhodinum]MBB5758790.1 hypothetical protein [Methylorubrum rhodinum]
MISAVSTSMAGLSAAFQRFDGAASRVAAPEASADPTAAVVETGQAKFDVAMNTALLKSSLDAEKRVLDILV